MNTQAKGLLITTLGVLCVVPDSLFIRILDTEPLVVAFWRNGLSGLLILLGVLAFQGVQPFRDVALTGRYGAVFIIAQAASGVMFVIAVSLTSVANVVFIIASMPMFAALFSRLFLGERLSPRMVITMAVVVPGLALIAFGSGETENAHWHGDLVAVCLAATFAGGLTAARKVRHVSMVPAVAVAYMSSALLIWLFVNPFSLAAGQYWLVLIYGFLIVCSASGLALGPRYITSAEVALLILLESVLAPLLVWFVLGENPGKWALIGGTIVIGALAMSNMVVLMRRRRRQ